MIAAYCIGVAVLVVAGPLVVGALYRAGSREVPTTRRLCGLRRRQLAAVVDRYGVTDPRPSYRQRLADDHHGYEAGWP